MAAICLQKRTKHEISQHNQWALLPVATKWARWRSINTHHQREAHLREDRRARSPLVCSKGAVGAKWNEWTGIINYIHFWNTLPLLSLGTCGRVFGTRPSVMQKYLSGSVYRTIIRKTSERARAEFNAVRTTAFCKHTEEEGRRKNKLIWYGRDWN